MESIAISQPVGRSLSDLLELQPAELEKVAAWCAQRCIGTARDEQLPERYHKYVDGVLTFLLEAVRSQITVDQLRLVAVEHGVPDSHAQVLVAAYEFYNPQLSQHLLSTGLQAQEIVDIEWRLDYHIRSKNAGRDNLPMYFLSLKVKDGDQVKDVNMIASFEEVQDLLAKVKDATKQVDRILASTAEAT